MAEPRLLGAALERGLGHAVPHQDERHVVATLEALRRIDQRLHAVDQAVGPGVEHRERTPRGAVPPAAGAEEVGVGAVGDECQAPAVESAGLELAAHARRDGDHARGAALQEPRQPLQGPGHRSGPELPQGHRRSRPVVAAVQHQRRAVAARGEPRRDPEEERRRARDHEVGPRSGERHRESRPGEGEVVPEPRHRGLPRRGVEPDALDRDAAAALGGAADPRVLGPDRSRGMVREPGQHPHLVARSLERAGEVRRARRSGPRLGREVLGHEQDAHRDASEAQPRRTRVRPGETLAAGVATISCRRAEEPPSHHWRWSGARSPA